MLAAAGQPAHIYQASYLLPFTTLWPRANVERGACPIHNRLRVLVLNVWRDNRDTRPPVLDLVRSTDPTCFSRFGNRPHMARALRALATSNPDTLVDAQCDRHQLLGRMILYRNYLHKSREVRYLRTAMAVEAYVSSC